MSLPIWIYVVVAGIFVSAFMAVKTAKEDKDMEEEWIEQEGQVYVERMNKEKEQREKLKTPS
ncbi:sporulation YhaL family protein [Lederbergia sp. NSJ-179]|uniref:sporulation YhaL family protein n=1 Tax=Lederbergia sp. NSJ-179 TaxID=2931402 RepID=UPI001FD2AB92|nr:sporulation YhaL family protein [Lederbergia sp. NSJ-179]MCJ7840426.1 sporulation YhaL family protein [Lederbergia sp. NSJ-179]